MSALPVRVRGIGPHEDVRLSLSTTGVTTIRGGSGSGKSTLMHAVALCLWGTDFMGVVFDRGMLNAPKASVAFGDYGRSLAAKGEHARYLSVDGAPQLGGTEAQFREVLAPAYRDGEAARLVMFPLGWVPLLEGAGAGRPLRTVLDRMLPGPTAADLLADLPRVAPRDERAAAALVTTLRGDAKTARGRAQGLRSAVPMTPPPAGPSDEQVAAARGTLDATAAARDDLAAWLVEDAEHRAGLAAVADWQRRRDAITAPQCERLLVTEALERAADLERAANDDVDRAVQASRVASNAHALATRAAEDWDRRAAGLTEPTEPGPTVAEIDAAREAIAAWEKQERAPRPGRPILDRDFVQAPAAEACPGAKGCQIGDRARAEADRVNTAHAAAWAAYDAWSAAQIPRPDHAFAVMDRAQAWARYNSRVTDLGKRPIVPAEPAPVAAVYASAAQEALDAARASAAAWSRYDSQVEALGARPADPQPLRARPETPPTAEAQAVVDAAKRAAERLADFRAAVTAAEAKAVEAETEATEAEARLTTAEGWLADVRSAPARALAGKLALLGTGALQVLDDDGKTRVEINGRPWYLASHGERIAADAAWRLRLRDAAGLGDLLVFVDDVTSVGGLALPDAPGVVLLQTTPGAFEVVA